VTYYAGLHAIKLDGAKARLADRASKCLRAGGFQTALPKIPTVGSNRLTVVRIFTNRMPASHSLPVIACSTLHQRYPERLPDCDDGPGNSASLLQNGFGDAVIRVPDHQTNENGQLPCF